MYSDGLSLSSSSTTSLGFFCPCVRVHACVHTHLRTCACVHACVHASSFESRRNRRSNAVLLCVCACVSVMQACVRAEHVCACPRALVYMCTHSSLSASTHAGTHTRVYTCCMSVHTYVHVPKCMSVDMSVHVAIRVPSTRTPRS